MNNELSDQDHKAIFEQCEKDFPGNFPFDYSRYKRGAEWGIRYARANYDPGPDWVASNILDGAAKRIKELEGKLEIATNSYDIRGFTIESYIKKVKELEEEVVDWKSKFDFANSAAESVMRQADVLDGKRRKAEAQLEAMVISHQARVNERDKLKEELAALQSPANTPDSETIFMDGDTNSSYALMTSSQPKDRERGRKIRIQELSHENLQLRKELAKLKPYTDVNRELLEVINQYLENVAFVDDKYTYLKVTLAERAKAAISKATNK